VTWRRCYALASDHLGSMWAACCCHHNGQCEQQDLHGQPGSLSMWHIGVAKQGSARDGRTCNVIWLLEAILLLFPFWCSSFADSSALSSCCVCWSLGRQMWPDGLRNTYTPRLYSGLRGSFPDYKEPEPACFREVVRAVPETHMFIMAQFSLSAGPGVAPA
jgi:hypothetical protein